MRYTSGGTSSRCVPSSRLAARTGDAQGTTRAPPVIVLEPVDLLRRMKTLSMGGGGSGESPFSTLGTLNGYPSSSAYDLELKGLTMLDSSVTGMTASMTCFNRGGAIEEELPCRERSELSERALS